MTGDSDAAFLDGLEARYGPASSWRRFRPVRRAIVKAGARQPPGRPLTPAQREAWRRWTATLPPGADELPF